MPYPRPGATRPGGQTRLPELAMPATLSRTLTHFAGYPNSVQWQLAKTQLLDKKVLPSMMSFTIATNFFGLCQSRQKPKGANHQRTDNQFNVNREHQHSKVQRSKSK